MLPAFEYAKYLSHLAVHAGDEEDPLTNMRVQKLLYYSQGWSLAIRDRPLFPDRIEAWAKGPVVVSVYHALKKFGHEAFAWQYKDGEAGADLSDDDRDFLGTMWEAYKSYSATKLSEMTHREDPWLHARKGCAPGDRCENEITQEAMSRYFKKLSAD